MGYVVVQFINWKGGKSVCAVPESWLVEAYGKAVCFFPKVNAAKLIEQQATVKADWKKYEIKKLSGKVIQHYEKAQEAELKAQFTSGIDSSDSDVELDVRKKKRRTMESRENVNVSGKSGTCKPQFKFQMPSPPKRSATKPSSSASSNQLQDLQQQQTASSPVITSAADATLSIGSTPSTLRSTLPSNQPQDLLQQQTASSPVTSPANATQPISSTPSTFRSTLPSNLPQDLQQQQNASSAVVTSPVRASQSTSSTPSTFRSALPLNQPQDLQQQQNASSAVVTSPVSWASQPISSTPSTVRNILSSNQPQDFQQQQIASSAVVTSPVSWASQAIRSTPSTFRSTLPSNQLQDLHTKIEALQRSVDNLVQMLASKHGDDSMELEDFDLPVDTQEAMTGLEDQLRDKTKRAKLRKLLARLGGRDLARCVKKVMEATVTYAAASEYTLLGRKRGRGNFSSLRLCRVIRQACLHAHPSATLEGIDAFIGSYLRHAPTRANGSKRRSCPVPEPRVAMESSESD